MISRLIILLRGCLIFLRRLGWFTLSILIQHLNHEGSRGGLLGLFTVSTVVARLPAVVTNRPSTCGLEAFSWLFACVRFRLLIPMGRLVILGKFNCPGIISIAHLHDGLVTVISSMTTEVRLGPIHFNKMPGPIGFSRFRAVLESLIIYLGFLIALGYVH